MATEASTSEGGSEALFTTDIASGVVKLKNVILNEFHVLRKFSFISLCNETLCVKLESDLGAQIGFQIDNENFDNENVAEQAVATFLADDFNQLFNTVNLVSEVILQPRQVQQVILTFRPSEPLNGSSKENDEKDIKQIAGQNASSVPLKRLSSNVTEIFQVNGKLGFSARILGESVETRHGEATRNKHQKITVQFNSSVCRSVLKTDVSEIVFEDCVPGGVFVKDFSIWNLSEIPGSFELIVKCGPCEKPVLELTDYDTGLPISRGNIKSFSHRRIRVTYKPKDVGDFTYFVHLQNNFDERNSKSVPFRCIVNPEQRQEGLLVTGVGEDGVLDFGDCYSGNGTCQLLTLRNVTQEALVVNLSSDHASGDKVTFYRQTELDLLSATSKARLKDVVSPVEDDVVSLEGAHKETLVLDKLESPTGPSVIVNKKSKVDLITLGKGEEKNLLVWFFPAGASDELKAARLQRRNFRLSLKCVEKKGYSKQRFSKIIQCKAQICTSIVKLSTQELNFGDCNVGSTKASSVQIHNLSELPALITPYVTSTILSIKSQAERVSIPAWQTHSLDIDLVPLKINHKYRKQIRVDNLLNKDSNQVLEVRAKIMDRHHVLFHSVYYKLQTPSASNFLTFDSAVANNPCVKIVAVENITDRELILDFNTSMPEELGIYTVQDNSSSEYGDLGVGDVCSLSSEASEEDIHENRKRAYAASVNKEKILETLEESQPRLSKAIVDSAPFPLQQGHSQTVPIRSPFSSSAKKGRMRMSLDLSTSSLSTSLSGLPGLETGPLSAITDDSRNEVVADAKSFGDTDQNDKPGTLKRVQSDAMLNAAEEASKVLGASRRSSDDDYLEEVLTRLGCATALDCSFTDEDVVKKFIDNHIRDRELTIHALEDVPHSLLPLGKLELLPGESRNLYVILVLNGQSHTDLQGRLQKLEAKVTIQMIEYDKERQEHLEPGFLEPTVDDDLLTREIPVEINVCRAVLSLAQKNISFGKLLTNEHRAKTLVLNNVSDVPLLYKIKKTGSIASGDLHIIDGRCGVLQPHRSQEVNFVFQPSLSGSFHETLTVSNVYDPNNDQVVTLKATISRAETFWLKSNSIDFGAVISGQWSSSQSFLFANTSKQSRTFMLREVDCGGEEKGLSASASAPANLQSTCAHPALIKLRFVLEPKRHTVQSHMRPEQEAIEALERKALAYERKGKGDKVAKIRKEIEELKVKEIGNGNNDKLEEAVDGEVVDLVPETKERLIPLNFVSGDVPAGVEKEKDLTSKNSDGFISFTLKPSESQVVLVSCYAWMLDSTPLGEQIKGAFLAYESKNQDVVKRVEFEATVCSDNSVHDDHVLSSMKPSNRTGEDSPNSLPSLSPTITPDSSVPTSPSGIQTPQMLSGHQASRKSSTSSLFSSIEPVDLNFDANSCKLLLDPEQSRTVVGSTNSEVPFPANVGKAANVGNSDVMAGGSLSSPEALFKVDLMQIGKLEPVLKEDQRTQEARQISLEAPGTTSLEAPGTTSLDREVAGEVVLEDHAGGDMMEASYLLRSLCPYDIWIHFVLDWHGARDLQLWVSDLGVDHASSISTGVAAALPEVGAERGSWSGPASPCPPVQLQWQLREDHEIERKLTEKPKLMTSSCLKGGTGQWITLRMLDEDSQRYTYPVNKEVLNSNVESPAMIDNGTSGQGFGIGILTMQSHPNGAAIVLLVRAKQLERCLKVAPTDIVFPESDLSTVLMKEITISNRSRFEVDFETKVSVVSKVLDKSPENLKLGETGTSAALSSAEVGRSFSLVEPVVSVTPARGRIEGNGSLTAKVFCQPVKSGKQGYTIHLQSSLCMSESKVNVTMAPRKAYRLRLPDVPMGSVLDMGYCFINASEGAKVVPLRLENLFAKPLSLVFRSNLTKQVFISLNPAGHFRTDEIQLQGAESETVYLCLRPGGDASAYKSGRCREVIGGMRISVKSIDTGMNPINSQGVQDEIMVKFRAIVGQSLLQVSTSLVDLGRLEEVGGFISGCFTVSNPSNLMPLDFTLSAGRASLSVVRGHLIGKEATPSTGSREESEIAVEYCLPVTEYGLIEDRVVVQNLSCPGQNAEVLLRVYVDRGSLKSHIQPPVRRFSYFTSEMESVILNENPSSNDSNERSLLHTTNFYGVNGSLLSNQSAIGISTKDLEKTLDFEGLSPRRTYSLPATNLELEDFQDRPSFDAGRVVGPLQDNHYLDMGIVYISLDFGGTEKESGYPAEREVKVLAGYSMSGFRSFQSSLLLTNSSDEALTLQPVSTLPLQVLVENHSVSQLSDKSVAMIDTKSGQIICTTTSGITTPNKKEITGSTFGWNPCGNKISILPGSATRLLVACDGIQPLSSCDVSHLGKGQLCAFEGLLAFCKSNVTEDTQDFKSEVTVLHEQWDFSQFLELLTVKGSMCVSYGEVETKEINLGKVGDANGWQDLDFDIEVHNSSDAEMVFQIIDAPDIFSFSYQGLEVLAGASGFTACQLPARGTNSIQVILHTSKLEHRKEARTWSWKLCLVNCSNRKNIMEVSVVAEMTVRNLRIVGLTESTLVLPPLTVPLQPHVPPCSRRFSVENLSTGPIGVALELHQVEDTESLVMLEVTSNSSNSSITELTLQPAETVELQVGARLVSDFIPHALRGDDADRHSSGFTISPRSALGNDDKSFMTSPLMNIEQQESSRKSWVANSDPSSLNVSQTVSQTVNGRNKNDITDFREDPTFSSEESLSEAATTVCLGHLYLYSSPLPDCIDIFGTLIQGPMLGVSPSSLQYQAEFSDTDTLKHGGDVGNGVDAIHVNLSSKVEYDVTSMRLESWEGWHDKSNFLQKIVVQNRLAFDQLQLKAWVQQTLSDDFGTQIRFLEVHPVEALVPPGGSIDIIVRFLSWSAEMYEAFLRQVSERLITAEYLTAAVFIQDVEERDNRLRVDVRITPPTFPQNSLPEAAGLVSLTQNCSSSKAYESAGKDIVKNVNHSKQSLPVLGLRGCTAVNGSPVCYEFNLGQQNISSGGHRHWNLTLVGDQERAISYRLCTISDGDASWLSISSSAGIVEALQQNTVKLSFSTKAMGVFSTYLVVENFDNPADLKTVHLSMEVVALKNARPEAPLVPFFYVLVQGDRAEGAAIDMAEIFYNFWYRNRSFVIVNEASVGMEFLLSSTLDHNDSTELNFSLENTSLKRFSSVTVDAKSSIRLWIHFCIGPPKEEPLMEDTCDELSAIIFVNCRLVKDYQRCIPFRAKCRYPQIGISSTDVVFSTRRHGSGYTFTDLTSNAGVCSAANGVSCTTDAPVNSPFIENEVLLGSTGIQHLGLPSESSSETSGTGYETPVESEVLHDVLRSSQQSDPALKVHRDDDLDLVPSFQVLTLRNLYLHRKLEYVVKNDSLFFKVDVPGLQEIPSAVSQGLHLDVHTLSTKMHEKACHDIVVRPNLDTLRENRKMVMKQKYIEEHLTIYNRCNPHEKYTVSLRLTAGHLRNFFAASGPKKSYTFERLELAITSFLSTFYSLMNRLLVGLHEKSTMGSRLDLQMSAHRRDSVGLKSGNSKETGLVSGKLVKQESWSMQNQDAFQEFEKCLESFSSRGEESEQHNFLFFDLQYLTDELVFYSLKERWSKGGATLELSTVKLAKLLYCALYRCQIFQLCLESCQSFTALATQVLADDTLDGELDMTRTSPGQASASTGSKNEGQKRPLGKLVPIPPLHCFKFIESWTGQLRHFLSFFPDTRDDINSLRDLNQQLQEILVSCRTALDQYS